MAKLSPWKLSPWPWCNSFCGEGAPWEDGARSWGHLSASCLFTSTLQPSWPWELSHLSQQDAHTEAWGESFFTPTQHILPETQWRGSWCCPSPLRPTAPIRDLSLLSGQVEERPDPNVLRWPPGGQISDRWNSCCLSQRTPCTTQVPRPCLSQVYVCWKDVLPPDPSCVGSWDRPSSRFSGKMSSSYSSSSD